MCLVSKSPGFNLQHFLKKKKELLKKYSLTTTLFPSVQVTISISVLFTSIVSLLFLFFLFGSVSIDNSLVYYWVFSSVQSSICASCLILNSENMCFVDFSTSLSLFWSVCFSKWPLLVGANIFCCDHITIPKNKQNPKTIFHPINHVHNLHENSDIIFCCLWNLMKIFTALWMLVWSCGFQILQSEREKDRETCFCVLGEQLKKGSNCFYPKYTEIWNFLNLLREEGKKISFGAQAFGWEVW